MNISLDLQKSNFINIINVIGFYMKSKLSKIVNLWQLLKLMDMDMMQK